MATVRRNTSRAFDAMRHRASWHPVERILRLGHYTYLVCTCLELFFHRLSGSSTSLVGWSFPRAQPLYLLVVIVLSE